MFGISWETIWIGIMVLTLAAELVTVGLVAIWMTGGALAALIAALLGAPQEVQIALFLGVTLLLLYFTRPWAVKFLNRKRMKTNYEATIGARVRVIERVDNDAGTGRVLYKGMEWAARAAEPDAVFERDDFAIVERVSGVTMILKSAEYDDDTKGSVLTTA